MKKFVILFALIAILATGTVFADHPAGTGIGVMGLFGGHWPGGGYGGAAFSLKLPSLPIYWGVNLHFQKGVFSLGVIGDYYLIDSVLVSDLKLHWFLGLGGRVNLSFNDDEMLFGLGARIPIGLSWQPVEQDGMLLEVFADIAPSLGVRVSPKFYFPAGGWQGDVGIRLWL